MRIGVDLDGVVYPFTDVFTAYCESHLHRRLEPPKQYDFYRQWGIDFETFQQLVQAGALSGAVFWQGAPIPGAVAGIRKLRELGAEVVIVTHRTACVSEELARRSTETWLGTNDIAHDGLFLAEDKTVFGLDILFDDDPLNIEAAQRVGERGIFYTHPWNEKVTHERVATWDEFVNLVCHITGAVKTP